MRRCLHSGNERLPGEIAFEAAKLFRCDDDHFVTPVHRHVLRSFTADASHQFAKARLGILQEPVAGLPAATYLAPRLGCFVSFDFAVLVTLTSWHICRKLFKPCGFPCGIFDLPRVGCASRVRCAQTAASSDMKPLSPIISAHQPSSLLL